MNTEMVSLKELLRSGHKAVFHFDDKSKTSKLLILISDGEDHSEGAQAAEEANKQGMRIITIGLGTRRNYSFKEKWCRTKLSKRQMMKLLLQN
jgi:Ca-activated chloride channel family protein